jgi:NADH-quinone oxidoreductase subunit E
MDNLPITVNQDQTKDFEGFAGKSDELIALLQLAQSKYGYLSSETITRIAEFLKMPEAHVYGVASFYAQFRFKKPGSIKIRVCQGTACHVQGGQGLSEEVHSLLGISPGETTPDYSYEFEEVACLGCCAQAPVVEMNGKITGKLSRQQLKKMINECK